MTTAVIQLLGKQHVVAAGDMLTTDRVEVEEGKSMTVADVLLVRDGDKVKVGTPIVEGAKVELTVVNHQRGEKIRVFKYKSKSRYRKTQGHRQEQTVFKVASIKA